MIEQIECFSACLQPEVFLQAKFTRDRHIDIEVPGTSQAIMPRIPVCAGPIGRINLWVYILVQQGMWRTGICILVQVYIRPVVVDASERIVFSRNRVYGQAA